MKEQDEGLGRRQFIGTVAAAGAIMMACGGDKTANLKLPPLLDQAPDGPPLKAGVVGCGGRGTGAALNFLDAGPNIQITALGDVLSDRLEGCRSKLKAEKGVEIPPENCFVGFDNHEKVIDSGVDIVIIATPPHFRPEQFAAAINANKHVFMEKPVAVDPVGARSIMATAQKADAAGLNVVTGTQRRHQRSYIATYKQIMAGKIGEIRSANGYWNGGQLWYRVRKSGWSDMEYMIRDWVNWCWLSGDHIVEQHVHNLDVINWFTGERPVKALGFGSRQRRVTGDQYDNFSIDFTYESGMHVHSMCRQISGCTNSVSEFIMGTKGSTNCKDKIFAPDGETVLWEYPYPVDENGDPIDEVSPYVQEHIHLVTAIRTNDHVNEAENTAISTMGAIMGRISAYTGKEVTWEEVMNSDMRLGPDEYAMGPVDIRAVIPVPGEDRERG